MEIGPEKVRICFKKWSGFGPILENIGPIQDLGALRTELCTLVYIVLKYSLCLTLLECRCACNAVPGHNPDVCLFLDSDGDNTDDVHIKCARDR